MKRLCMALALMLVLCAGSLWAQDVPKVEGFVGGSIGNIRDSGFKLTPLGWTASVNGNVTNLVGIVGEAAGGYRSTGGTSVKLHSFLGGVQFTRRTEKIAGFAQLKAGLLHASFGSGAGSSDNNLQLGFGGGVDWNISDKLAFRVFQFDWMPVRESGSGTGGSDWTTNVTRASIGVVFKGAAK